MLSFTPEVFEDIGLIVFDECHLLHPRNMDTSRRSIDAMLCLLNLNRLAPTADILLLSAMMKNTLEIAGWLRDLTARPCLGLDLTWKPTRQVRGCVVYASERLGILQGMLAKARRAVSNKNAPTEIKRKLTAQPFGFFCLRQTWISKARIDYTLLPLLDDAVTLLWRAWWTLVPHAERQPGKCSDRYGDRLTASEDFDIRSNYSAVQKHLQCHQHTLGTAGALSYGRRTSATSYCRRRGGGPRSSLSDNDAGRSTC